jgi:hypothetical protein
MVVMPAGCLAQGGMPGDRAGRGTEGMSQDSQAADRSSGFGMLPSSLPQGGEFPGPAEEGRNDERMQQTLTDSYRTDNDAEPVEDLRFYERLELRRALKAQLDDENNYMFTAADGRTRTLDFYKIEGYFKGAFSRRYMAWKRQEAEEERLKEIDQGYMAERQSFLAAAEKSDLTGMKKCLRELKKLVEKDLAVMEKYARRTAHLRPPPPALPPGMVPGGAPDAGARD